jgi:tetratricopeptide (TPR) repeat protein
MCSFIFVLSVASAIFTPAHRDVEQATSLIVQGRYNEAEPFLRRALGRNPKEAEAHYNLGAVLRATGRPDEAIGHYQAASRLFSPRDRPNQAKSLYGAALAAEDVGDPTRAIAAWQAYLRYDMRFAASQPAVAIARQRLAQQQVLAQQRLRPPGTQKAGR